MLKIHFKLKRQVAQNPCSVLALGTLLAIISAALPAWAALGGDVASVQADQVHMQGRVRTTTSTSYSVHEIQSASGAVVREYVSADKVFAVAWQAPWPPDMRQLLGSYFEQYVEAAKAQGVSRMGRRPLTINQAGLVVQMGGHARSFTGRAYLPDSLPAGVPAEAIQ
jgi:Protein of unknown function (DUF2844)